MVPQPIRATDENLETIGAPLLAGWLVEAALDRSSITYGEAMLRLEREHGFSSIGRATRIGRVAGRLMWDLQSAQADAPLLNALLVLQVDRMPSTGASGFMADHFGVEMLREEGIRDHRPDVWRDYFDQAAAQVYDFGRWPELYEETYGRDYRDTRSDLDPGQPIAGNEKDGVPRGRGGEGPNHKALRLWVKANPHKLLPTFKVGRAETEVDLHSGDRVDVVYYARATTIALEVKSADSNEADFERGIYQCVKYRAVLKAMDARQEAYVQALLVTEERLPGYLTNLARRLSVRHKIVPRDRKLS